MYLDQPNSVSLPFFETNVNEFQKKIGYKDGPSKNSKFINLQSSFRNNFI